MKKLLLMLTAFLAMGFMHGKAEVQLKLSLTDGTSRTFLLSENPVVTFPENQLKVTTPELTFSCDRAEVQSVTFGSPSSVTDHLVSAGKFSYLNGVIVCEGSSIEVYDLSGRMCTTARDSLSTDSLRPGMYIVRTNQLVVKIIKK